MITIKKVLVIGNNIIQNKQIINYISTNNENIKLYSMAYTYQEAIEIVRKQVADIILLDLKLPDCPGTELINYLHKNNITKYINSVIVISAKSKMLSEISKSPYIYDYIPKPYKLKDIENCLELITDLQLSREIKNKINKELQHLHYNFAYNGTRYLSDVIFEIYMQKDFFAGNLKKDIYPIIAKKYNKSVNTIHGNIKQATKCMYLDCEEYIINEYFNYNYFVQPKLKEIIFIIINKLNP